MLRTCSNITGDEPFSSWSVNWDDKINESTIQGRKMEKQIKYSNDEITVVWKPELCKHALHCFTELPEVFDPANKKWINPHGAETEQIIEQVKRCPSGALSFYYNREKESH